MNFFFDCIRTTQGNRPWRIQTQRLRRRLISGNSDMAVETVNRLHVSPELLHIASIFWRQIRDFRVRSSSVNASVTDCDQDRQGEMASAKTEIFPFPGVSQRREWCLSKFSLQLFPLWHWTMCSQSPPAGLLWQPTVHLWRHSIYVTHHIKWMSS